MGQINKKVQNLNLLSNSVAEKARGGEELRPFVFRKVGSSGGGADRVKRIMGQWHVMKYRRHAIGMELFLEQVWVKIQVQEYPGQI